MARRAGAVLAAIALAAASGCRRSTLWLVNGLDVPVEVKVAGQTVPLAPGQRRTVSVPSGQQAVEAATADGKGRESLVVEVPRWGGTAVYSVAGAAPLEAVTAPGGERRLLCGQRSFHRDDIDGYFEEPPKPGEPSGRARTVLRARQGDWWICEMLLEREGHPLAAAELVRAVRALRPSIGEHWLEAQLRWMGGDGAGGLDLLRAAAAEEGSRAAHRHYVHLALLLGRREEVEREYRQRSEREPDDVDWKVVHALALPRPERVPAFRAIVAQHPADLDARLILAWDLCGAGSFAEASSVLIPLGDGTHLSKDDRPRLVEHALWALAGLGKLKEAIALAGAELERGDHRDLVLLTERGLLADRLGRPDLEPGPGLIEQGTPDERAWRRLVYDSQVHPERLDLAEAQKAPLAPHLALLLVKAASDPKAALVEVRSVSPNIPRFLPEPVALALLAEAWRVGDEAAARVLEPNLVRTGAEPHALRAYLMEGQPTEELEELGPCRGALHLARARLLRARGDAAGAAAEENLVRGYDVFGGAAVRALRSWPSTAPAAVATGPVP